MESILIKNSMRSGRIVLLLVWWYVSMVICQNDSPSVFLEAPANVTPAAVRDSPVTFTCHFIGDSLFWRINDTLLNYATYRMFRNRGIYGDPVNVPAGEHKEILSVAVNEQNNFTKVVCQRTVFGQVNNFSKPAFLIIAGEPLPPPMKSTVLNSNTLLINWSHPFTWDHYPITEYYVVIETADSSLQDNNSTVFVNTTLNSSTSSYVVSSDEVPVCTKLAITMTASNSIGRSDSQVIMAALPDGPGEFLEEPNIVVRCTSNHIPHLQLNFTFPYLCPYSDAIYILSVRHHDGTLVRSFGPYSQDWMDGGELVRILLVDDSIVSNMLYTLTINVSNDISFSTTSINFYTCSTPTTSTGNTENRVHSTGNTENIVLGTGSTEYREPSTKPPTSEIESPTDSETATTSKTAQDTNRGFTMEVVAALAGMVGVVLLTIAAVMLMICCIACRRRLIKRRRACIDTVEHRPMVRNPIYEPGAIYEEIPGNFPPPIPPDRDESYVTIAASNTKEAQNMQMYEECKSMDDTYLPMQSAGAVTNNPSQQQVSNTTVAARNAVYSNATPTRQASRSNGLTRQHQSPETNLDETEERYIILVH